ncbi:MAG: regulatory iron-sulfur-containing complex subunit RicT, partial [Bdellovibrionota bacterium]
ARVDFRDLVKELVGQLRMRIELRQISLRDRAAAIGGIGVCGLQTCCSSFLSAYGNVSIKMAKNQNLALVPSKLNGVCGQIKCCIKYEEEVYSEKRTHLPRENSFIQTKNGDFGKILQLSILEEQFEMLTDKGIIRNYSSDMYDPQLLVPVGKKFPESFEFVTKDTGPMITFATCSNLLPQYRPQPLAKPPIETVVESDTEVERDRENEEMDVPNDEDDSASEQDIATEVGPQAVTPLAPPPLSASQNIVPGTVNKQEQEKKKQKERALQRFKKRTKRH